MTIARTFDWMPSGGAYQETTAITATSGDALRIRFARREGTARILVTVTGGGMTTQYPVPDGALQWAHPGLMAGDSVKVVCHIGIDSNTRVTGALEVDPGAVTTAPTPSPSGGFPSTTTRISAASTNAANIKTSAAAVGLIHAHNGALVTRFLKLFNKATAPTIGTDNPLMNFAIPAGGTLSISNSSGFRFPLGLGMAITAGQALTDNVAVGAGDVTLTLSYV